MAALLSEIERIKKAKQDIKEAIERKGVEVGGENISSYASKIDQIKTDKVTSITPYCNFTIPEYRKFDLSLIKKGNIALDEYNGRFLDYKLLKHRGFFVGELGDNIEKYTYIAKDRFYQGIFELDSYTGRVLPLILRGEFIVDDV